MNMTTTERPRDDDRHPGAEDTAPGPNSDRRPLTMSNHRHQIEDTVRHAVPSSRVPYWHSSALGIFLAHSAGCRHSDQSGKSAERQERAGEDRGYHSHPPRAARHPDECDSAGDDRGLRDVADLLEDRRVCPGVPVQHWRPCQGWRCPHRYVDPRPGADSRAEACCRSPRRGPDRRDAERASGRRSQPFDSRGTNRFREGRSEASPGQLHPLGVGIQAARGSRRPAASWTFRSRRDLSPVRGGRRRPRPGRSDGLGDDLRSRHGDRQSRQGPGRCRGRTRRPR